MRVLPVLLSPSPGVSPRVALTVSTTAKSKESREEAEDGDRRQTKKSLKRNERLGLEKTGVGKSWNAHGKPRKRPESAGGTGTTPGTTGGRPVSASTGVNKEGVSSDIREDVVPEAAVSRRWSGGGFTKILNWAAGAPQPPGSEQDRGRTRGGGAQKGAEKAQGTLRRGESPATPAGQRGASAAGEPGSPRKRPQTADGVSLSALQGVPMRGAAAARAVFRWLDDDESGTLTLDEIDAKVAAAERRGDHELLDASTGRNLMQEAADAAREGNGTPRRKSSSGMSVVERLSSHTAATKRSAAIGLKQKRDVHARWKEKQQKDISAQSLAEFKLLLLRRYGTVARGFKLGLDSDGNGRLSFMEFAKAAREIGYAGDVRSLWKELDVDGSGFITLDEMDRNAATALRDLRNILLRKFGSIEKGWKKMDKDGNSQVYLEEFLAFCNEVGFQGNAKHVFRWLDMDMGGFITQDEVCGELDSSKVPGES